MVTKIATNQLHNSVIADSPSHRSWIEDGILYMEYKGELSGTIVLENEEKAIELLNEHKIQKIPFIILLTNIDKTRFKLKVSDYAKVISTFDLPKRASGVWIVGATEEVKRLIDIINKVFFVNKIRFVKTLKEAQEAARSLPSFAPSIFEEYK